MVARSGSLGIVRATCANYCFSFNPFAEKDKTTHFSNPNQKKSIEILIIASFFRDAN